jgi:hypothetical protein
LERRDLVLVLSKEALERLDRLARSVCRVLRVAGLDQLVGRRRVDQLLLLPAELEQAVAQRRIRREWRHGVIEQLACCPRDLVDVGLLLAGGSSCRIELAVGIERLDHPAGKVVHAHSRQLVQFGTLAV